MSMNDSDIFSEVYEYLNIIEKEYYNRLPKKIIDFFEINRNNQYTPKYDAKLPIKEQIHSKKTLAIIALLDLNYWCDSESEKQEIREKIKNNESEYQKCLNEKYNIKDVFKNRKKQDGKKEIEETKELIKYKKENFIRKIWNRIIKFFK